MKFHLKDSDGYVVAVFDIEEADKHSVIGKCWTPTRWRCSDDQHNKEPLESDFLARVYMKWDSCTHWHFNGEDWSEKGDEVDAYYHLCGPNIFVNHIRAMCFVWKVAADLIIASSDNQFDSEEFYFDDKKIKPLIELMLDGYTIERVEE